MYSRSVKRNLPQIFVRKPFRGITLRAPSVSGVVQVASTFVSVIQMRVQSQTGRISELWIPRVSEVDDVDVDDVLVLVLVRLIRIRQDRHILLMFSSGFT